MTETFRPTLASRALRAGRAVALVSALGLIAGCAAHRAFEEGNELAASGQIEGGLAKLDEATRLDPHNVEYRIVLTTKRAAFVDRFVAAGDLARREGRVADAEASYARALAIDKTSIMAAQGLASVADERRHLAVLQEAEQLLQSELPANLATASDKVRGVLSEDPQHRQALDLKSRIDDARRRLAVRATQLAQAYKKPITLQFADTPLRAAFDFISQASGLSFLFDADVKPDLKVTAYVKNTSVEDAVRLILATNQLEQRVLNDSTLLIYPNTQQKLHDYQALSVRTFYVSNADVKAVSNTLKTLAKIRDMVVDERLGLIIVRDTPEAIRVAERLVSLQDQADPEVVLEMEVLEVQRSRLTELGVQWPSQLSLSPLAGLNQAVTLSQLAHLKPSTIQATVGSLNINAKGTDDDSNVLANPRIRVRNREKAKILIGNRLPVVTTTSTATGFSSDSVSYIDVGLKLEAEPTIYLDNDVAIKINLEVSTVTGQSASNSGTTLYEIGTRDATTVLRLHDGETQILAGLINDQDNASANKIPYLGDFPLLGRLFGSRTNSASRSEILLSVTPHVVRGLRRANSSETEFDSGTEAVSGAAALQLLPAAAAQQKAPGP